MARDKPTVSVKLDTRNEIIYYADCLIRQLGYNAFSYADIGRMMDVRPAAIHYHFQVKGDLGREVIQQELLRIGEFRRWNRKLSGGEQLKRLFNSFYNNSRSNEICLMGSLTPDFATFDPSMQKSVTELCDAVADWVTHCLEDEREKDRMRFEGTAGDRALLVISVLLSSLLLGRARGEEVFVRMADRLLADLGADWRIADLPPALQGAGASPWSFT